MDSQKKEINQNDIADLALKDMENISGGTDRVFDSTMTKKELDYLEKVIRQMKRDGNTMEELIDYVNSSMPSPQQTAYIQYLWDKVK